MYLRSTILAICLTTPLGGCQRDESISVYAPGIWRVTVLQGAEVSVPITLDSTIPGHISGRAPCNSYSAPQSAPYPWVEIGPIVATRAACPEMELENSYFAALARMTLAEVSGPVLILSNDVGELIEYAQTPD